MALQEPLGHFVRAAVAADGRYVGTRDAAGIREGVAVWEREAQRHVAPGSFADVEARMSSAEMLPDHPAGRDVKLALRAAG